MKAPCCVGKFVLPAASDSTDFSGKAERDPLAPADPVGPTAEGSLFWSAENRRAGLAGDAMHEDAASIAELLHQRLQHFNGRVDRRPAVT